MPAERVREPVDHVEESRDVDRVDERLLAHAARKNELSIGRCQLVRTQRERLEESERCAQPFVDRGCPPVPLDCIPDLLAECVRRDRAVGSRSEQALVERGDEAREELSLTGSPVRRTAHGKVERLGKRAAEELRAIVEGLQDIGRLHTALRSDVIEDSSLSWIVTAVDAVEPHRRVSSPAFSRSMPAATAAETVYSKISSSE